MKPVPQVSILETAARLFYAHGTVSVGVDRIIAESGVAKATFYRHFQSKDDLVAAVLARMHDDAMASLPQKAMALARKSGGSPVLALFDILQTWFGSSEFNGCAFVRTALERPSDERTRGQAADHKRALEAWIADRLRDDGLSVTKAKTTARAVMVVYDGAIVQARLHRDPKVARVARSVVQCLLATAAPSGEVE